MESTKPPYSETRFKETKKVSSYIKRIGYKPAAVSLYPSLDGFGTTCWKAEGFTKWFQGWSIEQKEGKAGKCLMDAFENILPF